MKKIIKKMKGKKVLSLVLAAIMIATTFSFALPMLKLDASAAGSITTSSGETVTQTQVVGANGSHVQTYEHYAAKYLNGASNPTEIVVPGLSVANDYVIQGMSYYPAKNWMLVTAYHKSGTYSSKVFALDCVTGDFVAMFDFYNPGTKEYNYEHGGGIAVSEHNLYYACGDDDRVIAYAPLSEFDVEEGTHKTVQLLGEADFTELGDTATAYVCYDDGILWTGNFHSGIGYTAVVNDTYETAIYGYRLQGSNSTEEWEYLTGAKGNSSDCKGNPSYTIAIDQDVVEQIQYAVVDNGRLYLSCSHGVGDDNLIGKISGYVGITLNTYSTLFVCDIDLSIPGTNSFACPARGNISTAYVITSGDKYRMPPMSEGLCFIDGQIYVTFESATNRFMNEGEEYKVAGIGLGTYTCPEPIDVVWKIDPYVLLGEERPSEEQSVYYEKVMSKSEIVDNEEYIIVYESAEKDPVSQKPILYAFDAYGGYKDYKLSKTKDIASPQGYAGMVGYPIIDYSIEDGKLYLYNRDKDDLENIRWTITGANNGKLRIENRTAYFKGYNNLYFNTDIITMATNGTDSLVLEDIYENDAYTGNFYLKCGADNYFWCNDGYECAEYTTSANEWYASQSAKPMYNGLTETKGTFHPNGLNSALIGGSVKDFAHGQFQIYKRVVDPFASTAESRIYTDLNAELQSDGTYTIDLETYAVSPTQYQNLKEQRPTDFILVLDASSSMESQDGGMGYEWHKGDLDLETAAGGNGGNRQDDPAYYTGGNIWIRREEDGAYCKMNVYTEKGGTSGAFSWYKHIYVYLYYEYNGETYWYHPNSTTDPSAGGTWSKSGKPDASKTMDIKGNNDSERNGTSVYNGDHYVYYSSKLKRMDCLKNSIEQLTYKIEENASATGLDHRIAVTQFGSWYDEGWRNTGMYTNDSTSMVAFSNVTDVNGDVINTTIGDNTFAKAFYDVDDFSTVRKVVQNIVTEDSGADTFSNFAFDMANGIISNSGKNYLADGDRSVAIIMITDGIPGYGGDDYTTANTIADLAIAQANEAKSKGAFIYTLQIGNNDMDGFSMSRYMDYVSSDYIYAQSMTESGDENPSDINYHSDIQLSESSTDAIYATIADSIFGAVQTSSTKGLATLDVNSILREQLSDAFIVPNVYDYEVKFAPGRYTKIGNYHFEEPSADIEGVDDVVVNTVTNSDGTKAIHIKGYDYSEQCIAVGKDSGNKLLVTLKGLLANPEANITNTSINNANKTAIYEDESALNRNNGAGDPIKSFPTEYFTIPEYTYVLDYGFDMYDNDVNGTMLALDDGPNKQNISNYSRTIDSGMVEITNNSKDLIYRHNPAYADDSGFVLIQRDSGKYDWFEIKVVPASNVLYEETALNVTNPTDNNAYHWNKKGSPQITYQDLSTENDVYGYDSHLVSSTGFSNGTHYYTTVNKNNMFSDAATVTFKGNGFDLLSACGPNTGVQVVSLRKVNDDDTTSFVKGFIVDTYYDETSSQLLDANSLVHQVPIVKWEGKEYGTYTVETKAYYLAGGGAVKNHKTSSVKNNLIDTGLVMNTAELDSNAEIEKILEAEGWDKDKVELIWFDDNSVLNGGTGVAANQKGQRAKTNDDGIYLENYIDGFRVYNPLEDTSNYIESEREVQYVNVLNNLANGSLEDATVDLASGNIAFVTGTPNETLSFANYNKFGPSDELYLKGGATQAVAFKTPVAPGGRVMISLRAVNGPTTATINGKTFTINSATEMYYDITETFSDTEIAALSAVVSITNTGAGILSVNNIKITNIVGAAGLMELSMDDLETVQYYADMEPVQATVINGVVTPVVEEEEIPEDNTGTDNDNTNDGTNTENGEKEEFSIFSLIELLIKLIENILFNAFNNGKSV